MAQLTCKNLTLGYDNRAIQEDLNFSIDAGDYLCIVGENGSGKSTLMKTLLHLQAPISGSIELGDGLKKNEIGYLPQQTPVSYTHLDVYKRQCILTSTKYIEGECQMKDKIFGVLQRVGRSFMLPIAILPVAGLLLGIGSSFTNATTIETYGLTKILGDGTLLHSLLVIMNSVGSAVFNNLPLIFAVGVAIGMAKKEKEVAALSAVIRCV